MKSFYLLTAAIVLSSISACKTKQASTGSNTGAPAVVYKTKADYNNNVPVTLSADGKSIVAYPAVKDIYYQGKLAYPYQLQNGYLLDNRGIGAHSAFLKITYEEYAKMNAAPALTELYTQILDKDPFTEIYNLGARSRFANEVVDINKIIAKGGLKKFTKVK